MFNWLRKAWNKGYYMAEDGYKWGSRGRRDRRVIKEATKDDVKTEVAPEPCPVCRNWDCIDSECN